MATTRHATRSSNLLGGHLDENSDSHLAGKNMIGKNHRALSTRGVMGTRNVEQPQVLPGKGDAILTKPTLRPGLRSTVNAKKPVASRQPMKPQAPPKEPEPVKAPSPTPMDISVTSEADEAFSRKMLNVEDIDKDDGDNPQLVSEYVQDIYKYMHSLEVRMPVRDHYLKGSELNGRMRGILVDWLVQVHLRFHLLPETLYLTVAIIDRFLQVEAVPKTKLQLVGVTSMLIASKYEEMYAPEVNDFVYITDKAYTRSDIIRMEIVILKALDFELGRPLPLHFLRRNSKAGEVDADKHTLAKYLMELCLVDYECVHHRPSLIAAAALCLSIRLLDSAQWTDTLEYYSTYRQDQLDPVIHRMSHLVMCAGSGKTTAIKTKYSSQKFMRISTLAELSGPVIEQLASKAH
ncbi:hypothetical protein CAPTEDRAFT_151793 [Capitella teleta]|uniref:Uncharacterized protein n=1 Tax=Capitella teleta TaxID=283909 RepID=R7TTK6_CAPTE|nr:hypothetical protein CAPTEDRAFT_151793 [Capitella teleta]|eukprot:ELT97248.1 hypothetical protein CAPTEDRAFT_151793 [Capitella teleta]